MDRRLELDEILRDIVKEAGGKTYHQPPSNIQMEYPCIVYKRTRNRVQHADNNPYRLTRLYQLTLISRKPEDPILKKLDALPMCNFERHFETSQLNHDVYNIYY